MEVAITQQEFRARTGTPHSEGRNMVTEDGRPILYEESESGSDESDPLAGVENFNQLKTLAHEAAIQFENQNRNMMATHGVSIYEKEGQFRGAWRPRNVNRQAANSSVAT